MSQESVVTAALALLPSGMIYLDRIRAQETIAIDLFQKLEPLFAHSSARGLLYLSLEHQQQDNFPESFTYWQQFSHLFMAEICRYSDVSTGGLLKKPPIPQPDILEDFCGRAPFFMGCEYLNPELLTKFWDDLYATLVDELKSFFALSQSGAVQTGMLKEFLAAHNSAWNLVGRIYFHLAENKHDYERPFAFLATYTTSLSAGRDVKHVPLGSALKEYADEKNHMLLLALLLPVQRAAEKSECIKGMLNSHEIYSPQAWNSRQAYAFLKDIAVIEAAGILVRVPNWWSHQKPSRPQVHLVVGSENKSQVGFASMFDFKLEITMPTGEALSNEELEAIFRAKEHFIKVKGHWVEVDPEKIQAIVAHWKKIQARVHKEGISFAQGVRLLSGLSLSAADDFQLPEDAEQWTSIAAGSWLKDTLTQLRQPSENWAMREQEVLTQYVHAQLRPYQMRGVQWLLFLYRLKLGGCLADDMGLGKTIQILAFLLLVKHLQLTKMPHLLVVPASLLGNWAAEIERFTPSLRTLFVHPSMQVEVKKVTAADFFAVDLVITTYAFVQRFECLRESQWDAVILDEAQAIKNASAQQTQAIKGLKSVVRFVLTGTPIENGLSDLWSLVDFFAPGLLGSARTFADYGKKLVGSSSDDKKLRFYTMVRTLIAPYMLRRLKTDKRIIADLPDKTETIAYCNLSPLQITLYQQAVDSLKEQLVFSDKGGRRRGIIFQYLMRFKQICNHPSQWLGYGEYKEQESGKFARLRELCLDIAAKQEKVLIFTQFQEIIPALAHYVGTIFKRDGLILHGDTPVKKRAEIAKEFAHEQGPPFFVLSLRAGGTGLNLTQAAHVIHFDRWWNPAVENQATDRAYRIGQKRNVMVYKLVSRGTLEEKIDALMHSKKFIAEEVLKEDNEIALSQLTNDQILDLVRLDIHKVSEYF